jgi:hypothetical protein
MRYLFFLTILCLLVSCKTTSVYILDHQIVKKTTYYNFTGKPDTIRMITLETGEVITHQELDRRFKRSIKEMKKTKRKK